MNRVLLTFLVLTLCCLKPAVAQEGTMKWRFASRSQVVPALKQTRGNLRATYDVLMCAVRQGYSRTALGFYEDIVVDHKFDASAGDSAAYSFAYNLSEGPRPWHWGKDRALGVVKKSSRANEQYFRDRALQSGSRSPEVLVLTAFYGLYQGDTEERGEAYHRLVVATKRAPRWADAHFWLGMAAVNYGLGYGTQILDGKVTGQTKVQYQARIKQLGATAMRAYDRAEQLDSGLRPYLYIERINACQQMATRECARRIPIYAAAHVRAFPKFDTWYKKTRNKSAEDFLNNKQKIADEISVKATE